WGKKKWANVPDRLGPLSPCSSCGSICRRRARGMPPAASTSSSRRPSSMAGCRTAHFLGVSRNTAAAVYERLAGERLVVSRGGSGIFVASTAAARRPPVNPVQLRPAARLNPIWLQPDIAAAIGFWREAPGDERKAAGQVDFRPALVDSRLFPFEVFRRISAKQIRLLERRPAAFRSPQGNQGNYRLREAVARHIAV